MKTSPALLVGLAWAIHFFQWLWITLVRQGNVAHRGEWVREIALRLLILALVVVSVLTPRHDVHPVVASIGIALVWVGTFIAILGRRTLGTAWGIGVQPHGKPAISGIYSIMRHPIYAGTVTALLGQWLALWNVASLLLLGGALVVIPLKIHRESSLLRRHQLP